jgi:membrane fusion protein (multidrug efflux system)
LVALDPRDYQLLVRRAHAMLDAARAGVKAARRRNDAALAKYREALTSRQRPAAEAARNIADEASDALSAKIAAEHQAEAALDQAQLQLDYTTIKAPVSGVVAKRSATVGERVQPSQRLLAIVQTSELWVTANFKETQLMRIHPGERVAIHVDALGRDYRGYVKSVAPATRSEFSLLPPENATGNFVKVVQRVAVSVLFDPGQDLRGLKPGMSVEPKVWVDGR